MAVHHELTQARFDAAISSAIGEPDVNGTVTPCTAETRGFAAKSPWNRREEAAGPVSRRHASNLNRREPGELNGLCSPTGNNNPTKCWAYQVQYSDIFWTCDLRARFAGPGWSAGDRAYAHFRSARHRRPVRLDPLCELDHRRHDYRRDERRPADVGQVRRSCRRRPAR